MANVYWFGGRAGNGAATSAAGLLLTSHGGREEGAAKP